MKLGDTFKTAIIGLRTNKTRSALTMLGIVIGISAVVTMISLGGGAQSLIVGQIASLGSNNIFIEPGPWSKGMERGQRLESIMEEFEIKTLKYEDALAIENDPLIEMVAPLTMGVDRIVYKNESKKITFLGTTPDALKITETDIILGNNFTEEDVKSMARKVVLGYKVKEDLFGQENPIGKIVRVKKTNFRVVGVLEERGTQMMLNLDELAYFPITTAQKLLLGQDFLRMIIAKAVSEDRIDEAVHGIRLTLRERHGIYNPEGDLTKDDFKVMSQKETTEILGMVTGIFTIFLSVVAGIALVVGGIGIMNIMLVSVTERTREIGLRKAVGARKKDILNQFLLEAVSLTILGGMIGIIFGFIGSYLGSIILGKILDITWGFTISFSAIILAFGMATLIGLIFGIYPARKAAELSPIEALRYE